jgi:hypothetical protein
MASSYISPALWSVRRKTVGVEVIQVRGHSKAAALQLACGLLGVPRDHLDAVLVLDLVKRFPPRPALLSRGLTDPNRPQAVRSVRFVTLPTRSCRENPIRGH